MGMQSGEAVLLLSSRGEPCQNNTGASSQPFVEPSCFGCLPKKIQGDAHGGARFGSPDHSSRESRGGAPTSRTG